ncbi:hypothetical protein BS78_03G238000 [Paspalum vaginatum]|nr:hypothetical protein BS78_03G238000 [Paspalum vaginatum]
MPVVQPLVPMQELQQNLPRKPRQRGIKLRSGAPSHKSARLAAITWPRGDIQSRARQVLMKRLGILPEANQEEENQNMDALLQRYFDLFVGPLSDLALKALVALCGLESPRMIDHEAA